MPAAPSVNPSGRGLRDECPSPLVGWTKQSGKAVLSKGLAADGRSACLNAESCPCLSAISCELLPDTSFVASGCYTVSLYACVACPAAGLQSPAAAILLDAVSFSPGDYLAIMIGMGSKTWRAERVSNGQTTVRSPPRRFEQP